MFRLILICLMVVTIFMPRRFYRRYMQVMAGIGILFITLVTIAYEDHPDDAGSRGIYIMIGFIGMNAAIILTKFFLLRATKPNPLA